MKFRLILSGSSSNEWKQNYLLLEEFVSNNKLSVELDKYSYDCFGYINLICSTEDILKIKALEYVTHITYFLERKKKE